RKRTYLPISELLPPPALRERRHRGLARRLVAVRRRAILVVTEGERPHPRRSYRRSGGLEDAADDRPAGEHVEVFCPVGGRSSYEGPPSPRRLRRFFSNVEIRWSAYSLVPFCAPGERAVTSDEIVRRVWSSIAAAFE